MASVTDEEALEETDDGDAAAAAATFGGHVAAASGLGRSGSACRAAQLEARPDAVAALPAAR
eukprot:SAG31_NODE_249_length_19118_cov_47.456195_11_plen_62_part_00